MSPLELAISRLKILDLSEYPGKDVAGHLSKFGSIGSIDYYLHPGKKIIRARPHNNDGPFKERHLLSYKPQQYNTTYQRGSTPERTM
ncbi:MAG: hypothetical protein ABI113_12860, partial [Mucilaginibacter sp.]